MTTDPTLNVKYKIHEGDTLSLIARRFYNDPNYWSYLYQINQRVIGDDPNFLAINLKILIPFPPGEDLYDGEPIVPAPRDPTPYTVRHGDTLSGIAQNFYGDSTQWSKIYNRNQATIGPDPNHITPGMELELP